MVKGRVKAIVAVGPNPGKTPTTVPMKTPSKQASKFTIDKEEINPLISCSILSTDPPALA